ncbi:MAG: hypothetical protein ABIH87_03480 [bacterium]
MTNKYILFAFLACLFFLIIGFLSVSGFNWKNLKYSGSAITGDEVAYISSGYYSIKTGKNFLNPEHPPLIKNVVALPLLFINPSLPQILDIPIAKYGLGNYPYEHFAFSHQAEIENNQWDWGRLFLFGSNNDSDRILFWSRLAMMLFNGLLLLFLFFSLSKFWCKRSAFLGLLLICILPLSLSHGSLVILDFATALLQILAIIWFSAFIWQITNKKSSISGFLLATLFLSLSLLAKSSSLVLLPVLFTGGLIYILSKKFCRPLWWNYLLSIAIMSLVSISIISIYYIPHVHGMDRIDTIRQVIHLLPGNSDYEKVSRHFILQLNQGNLFSRATAQYLLGVSMSIRRAGLSEQQQLYFMGDVYGLQGAGWKYYPILILTKIPLAVLCLILLGLIGLIADCVKKKLPDLLFVLFFVYALFFMALAWYFNLQMGLRYILPSIFIILLLSAKLLSDRWQDRAPGLLQVSQVMVSLIIIGVLVSLLSFPYYISYYNILAGGSKYGYVVAVDSNYDWGGQDIKRLAQWRQENHVGIIYADLFTNAPPAYYLGNAYRAYLVDKDNLPASGSYVAISAHIYQTRVSVKQKEKYFNKNNLVDRAGQSIFIYRMP